jgi:hypothetical protein
MMDATLAKTTFTDDLYELPSRVLVLIPTGWDKLPDPDQVLLARILGSVKLSLAAVQIISAQQFSINDALVYQPLMILSFGVPVTDSAVPYQAKAIEGIQVIVADAIGQLDEVRKKNLWLALKQVFQL